jgi:hypothetical protein
VKTIGSAFTTLVYVKFRVTKYVDVLVGFINVVKRFLIYPAPVIVCVEPLTCVSVFEKRIKVQIGLEGRLIYEPAGALVGPVGPIEVAIVFIAGSTFFVAIAKELPPAMGAVTQLLHTTALILVEKYTLVPADPAKIKYIPL